MVIGQSALSLPLSKKLLVLVSDVTLHEINII